MFPSGLHIIFYHFVLDINRLLVYDKDRMAEKISNHLLRKAIAFSEKDISLSLVDFAETIDVKGSTFSSWHRKLKSGEWAPNYSKTEDGVALDPELVEKFTCSFIFSASSPRILKRLVNSKCLKNRSCFAKQHKVLKKLFLKYPDVNFWLYADFGEPRDDILFFTGKAEYQLKKKYVDFHASDKYTPFSYKYSPLLDNSPKKKIPKKIWDFYK